MASLPLSICSRCREQSAVRMMKTIRKQSFLDTHRKAPCQAVLLGETRASRILINTIAIIIWQFHTCIMYSVHFQAPHCILPSLSHSH